MAKPVIQVIGKQTIMIDTAYSLAIAISGDSVEVTVDGLQEGFYQDWDAMTKMLTIATDEATRLLSDAIWTVSAKETATSEPVTSEIEYEVVAAAPVIEEIGSQTIYKGIINDIFVPIQNRATLIRVDGLLAGSKSDKDAIDQGEETVEGVRIKGPLPVDAELTVDATQYRLRAENMGGIDTYDMPIEIRGLRDALLIGDTVRGLQRVSASGMSVWQYTTFTASRGTLRYLRLIADNSVYITQGVSWVHKFSSAGALVWGQSLGSYRGNRQVDAAGNVYGASTSLLRLRKFSASDGMEAWTYVGVTNEGWVKVLDNGDAYVWSRTILRRVGSSDGTDLWTYTFPQSTGQWVTSDDGHFYAKRQTGANEIYKVTPSGSLAGTYTMSVAGDLRIDGNVLYWYQTVSTNQRTFHRLSDSGEVLWSYNTDQFASVLQSLSDGSTVFAQVNTTTRNVILTKVSSSGTEVWSWTMPAGTSTLWSAFVRNSVDGSVYAINAPSGIVYKVDADGNQEWENSDGIPSTMQQTTSGASVSPVFGGLYFSRDRVLYHISSAGSLLWTYTIPSEIGGQIIHTFSS